MGVFPALPVVFTRHSFPCTPSVITSAPEVTAMKAHTPLNSKPSDGYDGDTEGREKKAAVEGDREG